MTQPDQFLIVVEYTVFVFQGSLCVDLCIVFVHTDPWRSCGKSGICAVIPLHRSSGVITADHFQAVQHLFFCHQTALGILFVCIDSFDIFVIINGFEICIGHTDFFSLIDIRRTFQHMQTGCDHLCGYLTVHRAVITESGYGTRLIVVIPVQTVPCFSFQVILPFVHDRADFFHFRFLSGPFAVFSVCCSHVFELEYHVQFASIQICIFLCFLCGNTWCFTNGDQIKFGKYTLVHFLQIFVYMRSVAYIW